MNNRNSGEIAGWIYPVEGNSRPVYIGMNHIALFTFWDNPERE